MGLLEELKAFNVDVEGAVARLNGNASLYEKLLHKFADMLKTMDIEPDSAENAYMDAVEKVHAIKGTAGNLSVTPLFEAYTEMLRLLRENQPAQTKEVYVKIFPVQNDIIQCIEKYL